MISKVLIAIMVFFSSNASAETIPDWYKEGIEAQYNREPFSSIILFEVERVTLVSVERGIYSYRVDTRTLKSIKGVAPIGNCYSIGSEGSWPYPYLEGDKRIAVLLQAYEAECGIIEPGYGALGTKEYIDFFETIVNK